MAAKGNLSDGRLEGAEPAIEPKWIRRLVIVVAAAAKLKLRLNYS